MRIKRSACALLCLCLCAAMALSGCRLAREDGQGQASDRLIGVLITAEWLDLFDADAWLQDNVDTGAWLQNGGGGVIVADGDTSAYQGRLYAELTERTLTNEETGETLTGQEYRFPDTEGLVCIVPRILPENGEDYLSAVADDAAECSVHLAYTDDGDEINLDVTVYLTVNGDPDEIHAAYINPVYQAADGSVYTIYEDEALGTTVVLRHDGGYTTRYQNLAAMPTVSVGQRVTAGQTIGAVGATAILEIAQEPHLHFAVTCNGESVDPMEFLD